MNPNPAAASLAKPDFPHPIVPAQLTLSPAGVPFSEIYGDIYHSDAGAVGQACHVFLGGNGLPSRWQGREHFTIVETGFGLGLNFLTTWAAWKADPGRCRHLHFVSLEKHPFTAADLAAAYRAFPEISADPELAGLASQLQQQWPALLPGAQRLHFDHGQVSLTLFFGDALQLLPQIRDSADAFYLDGFAPTKNPELWSEQVFRGLARLAGPGATLATWTVAAAVREGLKAVGFTSEKAPGFGSKRDMLRGQYRGPGVRQSPPAGTSALVIGAGFAGTSVAERLAARGFEVTVIDREAEAGCGASGNRVGVLRPLPSLDDNRLSRLTRAAFLYTRQHLQALSDEGLPVRWGASGVLHLARDASQEALQKQVVDSHRSPPDYLRFADREEASRLTGQALSVGGWHFPSGGWGVPPSLCRANLARHPERIRTLFGRTVARLEQVDGLWQALDEDGQVIAAAKTVVLANAADAKRLAGADWLPLRSARGQTTLLPESATPPLDLVVCRLGYVTPAVDGLRVCGASFLAGDEGRELRPEEHQDNLAKLNFILPGFIDPQRPELDPTQLQGRVGFRPISPDRLPMLGPLPENAPAGTNARLHSLPRRPGLWLASGFGARGFVWSAFAGEFLASQIAGEPLPLEGDLADALDPARFLLQRQRRPARPAAIEEETSGPDAE